MYTVNWFTKVVFIPTSDMTLVSGTTYNLFMQNFLIEIRRLEASFIDGLWAPQILNHKNPELDFAGADYAGFDKVVDGYTVAFSTSATRVNLIGSNNNIVDIMVVNGVSVVPSNSAGLQRVETGVSGLTSKESATLDKLRYMKQYVFIDEKAGPGGDGSAGSPFNVTADGVDFAEANDIFDIMALSDITLERTLKNFTFSSIGLKTIDFAGENCDKSHFNNVKLTGLQVGKVVCKNVTFLDGLSGLNGDYDDVKMGGDVALLADATVNIVGIAGIFMNGIESRIFDMSAGTATKLNVREATGAYGTIGMNHADKLATFAYSGGGGFALLDTTNTLGTIGLAGILDTAITDNTEVGCSVIKLGVFPGSETMGTAVWSSLLANNILSGSFGEAIGLLWDEAGGDRIIDGTTFQEIFYKAGGIEVMRFNLFDADDNPSIENVYKRVRV